MSQSKSQQQRETPYTTWVDTTLGEILPVKYGKARSNEFGVKREFTRIFGSNGGFDTFDRALTSGPAIVIGRKGAAGSIHYSPEPCWPIDTAFYTEGNPGLFLPFFRYLLESLQLVRMDRSTAIPSLSRDDYNAKVVRFPLSLSEQKLIVAKIEELFSELDKGIENLKQARAQLAVYRQALLKHAFEGKLTAAWRLKRKCTKENGSELVTRLLMERRKKWNGRGKYFEPEKPKPEYTKEIPNEWFWASPEQVSSFENYSLAIGPFGSNLKVSDYKGSGVPLVFVRNIRAGRFGDQGTACISSAKAEELRAHSVSGGDILITKMGEPPGDAAIYPKSAPNAVITADCIKLRLSSLLTVPRYFLHAINSPIFRQQIAKITNGVAQKKVSLARFATLAFPIPPLEEQEQIVSELDMQLSAIEKLETEIDSNFQKAEALRQSILKKAFEGELVPQDSSDEPAAVLLARVRAEREAQAATAKPKKTRSVKV